MSHDERVKGLDSIRFVLACWVAIGHIGLFPLLQGADTSSRVVWLVKGLYGASVNGPAAVIVFFVISGFCIHFPYRNGGQVRLLQYYPRRYLRILVPLATAVGVAHLAGVEMPVLGDSILWSIVCEEIYYMLYPAILWGRRRCGWGPLLALAFAAGVVVAWTNPRAGDYPSYGWQLNWLLGLPCWLLGCHLAEAADSLHLPVSRRAIWAWRLAAWVASCVCLGLRFHSPVGYPHTLNLFAVLGYFWLRQEVRYFRHVEPPRLFEWAGKWSYSLYLIHVPANAIYSLAAIPNFGFILSWLGRFGWALGSSYGFYLAVEKPSHSFARWVGRRAAGDRRRKHGQVARRGTGADGDSWVGVPPAAAAPAAAPSGLALHTESVAGAGAGGRGPDSPGPLLARE